MQDGQVETCSDFEQFTHMQGQAVTHTGVISENKLIGTKTKKKQLHQKIAYWFCYIETHEWL
jgi:hypothetical protein